MNLLAIDTAVDMVSVCVADDHDVLASASVAGDRRHGETLAPMIRAVLEEAEREVGDIGRIAVDIGPGLFTGLRVGIATAKAMAEVLESDLIGVSSLEVLAAQAIDSSGATGMDVVASIIDARRGEIFWSIFRSSDGEQLTTPRAGSPSDCLESIAARGQSVCLVGTGLQRHSSTFVDGLRLAVPDFRIADDELARPSARTLAGIARRRAVEDVSVDELVPMYLRAPDAEINWRTRSGA